MNVKLKEKLINNDVVSKVWRKVDSIAESKGMTREEFIKWSGEERYRSSISDYEHHLIYAYQISKVIERLEIEGIMLDRDIQEKYFWLQSRYKDFSKVDKAIKHLTDVCAYIQNKYGTTYEHEWLLDDNNLYNQIVNDDEKRSKKGKQGKSKPIKYDF